MSASYEVLGNMSADEYRAFLDDANQPWVPVAFEQFGLVKFEGVVAKSLGLFTVGCIVEDKVQLIDAQGISRVVSLDDEDYLLESVEDFKARGL